MAWFFLSLTLIFEQFSFVEGVSNEKIQRGNVTAVTSCKVWFCTTKIGVLGTMKDNKVLQLWAWNYETFPNVLLWARFITSKAVHVTQVWEFPREASCQTTNKGLRKLGNTAKSSKQVQAEPSTQSHFQKENFTTSGQKLRKSRY